MSAGGFSPRTVRWLVAIAATSLAVSAFLAAFGGEVFEVPSVGPDAFSRSAVGHRAFVEVLRGLGYRVSLSRHATADRAGDGAVVIVAEPSLETPDLSASLAAVLERAPRALLVLPKRTGLPAQTQPRWLGVSRLLPVAVPQDVLDAAVPEAHVVRPAKPPAAWTGPLPAPALDAPQLLTGGGLEPLVASDAGVLAGELRHDGRRLVVLSDPDVLASHGLGRGDNAALAVALLDRLGAPERLVLVDETLHGHELRPSLARELLRFPLVLATLQALLAAGLLAWAAAVRFGRPDRTAPPLGAGKEVLVERTAALLAHGGHSGPALAAYWRAAQERIARALRPPGERAEALEVWLRRLAASRGRARELQELERRVAALRDRPRVAHEALRVAMDIHRWTEEMTNGTRSDP